jgi:hypothetical protein
MIVRLFWSPNRFQKPDWIIAAYASAVQAYGARHDKILGNRKGSEVREQNGLRHPLLLFKKIPHTSYLPVPSGDGNNRKHPAAHIS